MNVEALENFLDDNWPREGGRSHIVRVLAEALAEAGFREPGPAAVVNWGVAVERDDGPDGATIADWTPLVYDSEDDREHAEAGITRMTGYPYQNAHLVRRLVTEWEPVQ